MQSMTNLTMCYTSILLLFQELSNRVVGTIYVHTILKKYLTARLYVCSHMHIQNIANLCYLVPCGDIFFKDLL